jgi:hypothetical protein
MGIDWFVGFVELLVHSSWFVVQSSQPLVREEAMSNQEAESDKQSAVSKAES